MADAKTERQKVKEITDRLEEGLKELFESETYKSYLSTMSKFHNYSYNNIQLIAMQRPDATLVAGYRAWQKNFGRHVNRGEKAIQILAPAPYKIKEERDKLDPVTGELMFDENGMPQREEVEIKIPAFRVVSVFDVAQTDGKPLPELEAKELLSTVEGYEDFKQAVMNFAPVPISFEDIPGTSKGYFNIAEKRIAVQEGMGESQTLKTMVHETAHSMLHDREVNKTDILAPAKDRNTQEVEAESIAYTVCQHFGIETSDYSFGYIGGWSSGRDMKELKSSLDTIRRTASEIITGIEGELQAMQLDRDMMRMQEKESILLVQNHDLSEYSLLSVRGMDRQELVDALSAMGEDDKTNVAAYLDSRGAWTAEIANGQTGEFGEYHLDVRYYSDTDEIVDVKAEMKEHAQEQKAEEKPPAMGQEEKSVRGQDTEMGGMPDPAISMAEMEEYGYGWEGMLPLTQERALELFDQDLPVYLLHKDGSETLVEGREQLESHEGICGIEKTDWENERAYRAMQRELAESAPAKEAQLLYGDTDRYGIYQLKDGPGLRDFRFAGTADLVKRGIASDNFQEIQPGNYNLVYTGELSQIEGDTQSQKLGRLFLKFNTDHPEGFKGHSLSVSDIVVLHEDGKNSAHFVDSYGFTELPHFTRGLEGVKEQETELPGAETVKEDKSDIPIYRESASYAREQGELEQYRISNRTNGECKAAVDSAIRENFDGMHLNADAVKPVIEMYGAERVALVLSATLQYKSWDGRFSRDNKEWAAVNPLPESVMQGADIRHEMISESHPAVLDGFVDLFREELKEREKEIFTEQGMPQEEAPDTSGHDVQKPEPEKAVQSGMEQQEPEAGKTKPGAEKAAPEPEPVQDKPERADMEEDIEDGDEIIDLGDERNQVLAEMKKSLAGEQEKELAFRIADRYISIQETEGGYDYSIMGADYKEIDGGVYDNPDVAIRDALHDIVEDLKSEPDRNGAKGSIQKDDELIPIDYDGLMENNANAVRMEEANKIEPEKPQGSVVADFKAKTDALFHEISEMNPAEIEETVKCHVQAKLDETGMDAQIVDVAVTGSRCRGLEREGSDLDVVVELSTEEREDVLFDVLNEGGLSIGGITVDINPITEQRTGTLETYLPQAEAYLDGLREAREQEAIRNAAEKGNPVAGKEEITFTVSECGEFHNLGEHYEGIPTAEEAIAIWKQIPPERMDGIPAIGIKIHKPGNEPYQDTEIDILSGSHIDLEALNHAPGIRDNPQAMEFIAELAAKLPGMEIDGKMSGEMEARVWEIRMPDLTPAERLAVEFDRFVYDYDRSQYHDSIQSMTENVADGAEAIEKGDIGHMTAWLADVAAEGADPEETKRAVELLEKLTEYKPLAKIEELEEQNYNMVDNVLNNGAGEKAQKEEARKVQDRPAARTSLKARLAEKKAQVAGQGKDHDNKENEKKNQREM